LIVQARKDHAPAAFQSSSTIVHIGGEMFQCAEKKRTEPPFLAVGASICASLDQVSEKALDQIPGILRATSLSA
jgi:thiamine monophosphate synthase